ncbi:MAG: hypothetical protein GY705_17620 [Bacteroidetes bacterium]|nr:hypothetical protein [Bacteroidota bacterium]
MAITNDWLKNNATGASFVKGEDIYDCQDIEVIKKGDQYEAQVWGTELYEVTIDDTSTEPACTCTCPYDWGGICKHIIAVGLAILEEDYIEEETQPSIVLAKEQLVLADVNDFYNAVFEKAEFAQQRSFLKQMFEKNRELRLQFLQFLNDLQPLTSSVDVLKIRDKVNSYFSEIDLDVEDYFNDPYSGYDYHDDGDSGSDWAAGELQKGFDLYFKQSQSHLLEGRLSDCISVLLGVYEGIHNVEEPVYNDDYWELLEDYEDALMEIFRGNLSDVCIQLENTVIAEQTTQNGIDRIFERVQYYTENVDSKNHQIVYNFKVLAPLLLALINSEKSAKHLLSYLEKEELTEEGDLAYIMLKISKQANDSESWTRTAENNAANDPQIAMQLMESYLSKNYMYEFYRIARLAFPNHQYELSEFLLKNMTVEGDKDFYVEVLSWHTKEQRSIQHYKELRELISEEEKERFIGKVEMDWSKQFFIQILEVEARYDNILDFARKNVYEYNFFEYIKPAVPHFPKECYAIISKKAAKLLEEGRGRKLYRQIAKELELIANVQAYRTKVCIFAAQLVSKHSRLRALKEELQFVKLI